MLGQSECCAAWGNDIIMTSCLVSQSVVLWLIQNHNVCVCHQCGSSLHDVIKNLTKCLFIGIGNFIGVILYCFG